MATLQDRRLLHQVPLFAALPPGRFARVIEGAVVQALPRGTLLCRQGERPEYLYVLLSGRVALLGESAAQVETIVEFFDAGDVFIAAAVMLNAPLLMSARLVENSRVAMLPAEAFRRHLAREPALALAMATQLAHYWRKLIRQIKELRLKTASERLAVYLMALSRRKSGAVTLTLPVDRRLIASRIGITPESLSRAFNTLRPLGVAGRGPTVTIASLGRLRAFCDPEEPP